MSQIHNRQSGFHVLEVIVISIVVVGLAALIGFRFWQSQQTAKTSVQATAPTVKSVKDLEKADTFVQQIKADDNLKDLDSIQHDIDAL